MTLDEIKAAVDAGKTVHWFNEGYIVHKDDLGQYFITFAQNASTIGLTNQAGDQLNGKEHEFFITSDTLGLSLHCEECGSEDVMQDAWAAWNAELQMHEVVSVQDHGYCNTCDSEAKIVQRKIRDYGGGKTADQVSKAERIAAAEAHQAETLAYFAEGV